MVKYLDVPNDRIKCMYKFSVVQLVRHRPPSEGSNIHPTWMRLTQERED